MGLGDDDKDQGQQAEEAADRAAAERSSHADQPAPPADFNTLILSLSTSALMHMGLIHGPDGTPTEKNLVLAKHSIDLIALLEKKTEGNLTGEEERLVSQVLYDLRMQFVVIAKH